MPYDELIKRLNYCRNNAAVVTDSELAEISEQAADAIEELQSDNAALNGTVSNLIQQIAELSNPRWIPVTEEHDGEV